MSFRRRASQARNAGVVKAALDDDIGDALPYLNATLKGAIYNHAARALTWRMGGHAIAIRPREIAISNLTDQDAAATEVKRVADLINRTWERRAEITPSTEMRQRLKPMDVYKLLPATNCKACGQPTCFTFALKLTAGEMEPEQCPPLVYRSTSRENAKNCWHLLEGALGVSNADNLHLSYDRHLERRTLGASRLRQRRRDGFFRAARRARTRGRDDARRRVRRRGEYVRDDDVPVGVRALQDSARFLRMPCGRNENHRTRPHGIVHAKSSCVRRFV